MKIIDFEQKGNVIRFYLGEKSKDWGWTNPNYKDSNGDTPDWLEPSESFYGDGWSKVPYEHNADTVYSEFIKGYTDVYVPFDDIVLEPSEGQLNSRFSKNDMVARIVPCIIIIPSKLFKRSYDHSFETWVGADEIKKYYFGDELEPDTIITEDNINDIN